MRQALDILGMVAHPAWVEMVAMHADAVRRATAGLPWHAQYDEAVRLDRELSVAA